MANNNLNKAQSYYTAMYNKNYDEMASYVHPNINFTAPLATIKGKDAVVQAAKNFSMFFKKLTIQEKFESENKVMLVLEFECPEPIGVFRAASFLSFEEELISHIELFYDPRPFEKK